MANFPAIYKEFSSRKVFTLEEVKAAFPNIKLASLYQQISYLIKRGYIGKVKSELYVARDERYISPNEFKDVYEQARRTRAAVRGFINYLKTYESRKAINREP